MHSTVQTWWDTYNYTMSFLILLKKLHLVNPPCNCLKNDNDIKKEAIKLKHSHF